MSNVIFDKKNVLVIGGAGFIGSHLCDELIRTSKVICVDDFSSSDERNIDHLLAYPDFAFIKHDISEPLNLEMLPELHKFKVEFQGIQEIYNLACPMSALNFEKNIIKVILANSYIVKNALDIALKYNAKFLHISSSVVYGKVSSEFVQEDDLGIVNNLSERSAYDEGKRFAETLIDNYRRYYNLDTKIIRLFRTYGPRMPINDGQMIPDFVSCALDNNDLIIYGDENFSSSFCYVLDVVDALVRAMEADFIGPMNVGSDISIKLTDLANKIISKLNSQSKIVYKKELLFMKPLLLPRIRKAKDTLNWMPIMTIDKGLENTISDLQASKGIKDIQYNL